MANKKLFQGPMVGPAPDAVNEAGGTAYSMTTAHALAQYTITGCLNSTFYAEAEDQLVKVLEMAAKLPPEYLAKLAVYCREKGFMKDIPALLCAILAARGPEGVACLKKVFPRVIDNAKMLRNFVQIVRSGTTGRKSFGTAVKRLITDWLASKSDAVIFKGNVGNDPSMADIIKMVHPKPDSRTREALYAYIIGKEHDAGVLPDLVKEFEQFKITYSQVKEDDFFSELISVPDVPFQMISGISGLSKEVWRQLALSGGWHMIRMNLNTFLRQGVFQDSDAVRKIAAKLRDQGAIEKAKVFPYQLFTTYRAIEANPEMPTEIKLAVQDALDIAIRNVPKYEGQVVIGIDISGSMCSAITGYRKGATSTTTCVDVAALISSAVLSKNEKTIVLPFNTEVRGIADLNPRDSVVTNAQKLARCGGGTSVEAPLEYMLAHNIKADLVIIVSDNQSWFKHLENEQKIATGELMQRLGRETPTPATAAWNKLMKRNPKTKLVCIDIQPYSTVQVKDNDNVLNVGGFSDSVFEVIDSFLKGLTASHWTDIIGAVEI